MRQHDIHFSAYGQAATRPSPVSRMMSAFATEFRDGVDINLGVGYVNEATIPGELLLEAFREVSRPGSGYRQVFNYGSPRGAGNLVTALRGFLARHGAGLDATILDHKQILIGLSGATSLLDSFADLLRPGIVVTADPMYYIYCHTLARRGHRILAIPEDEDGVDPVAVARAVEALGSAAEDIAYFYFVTVNNPTCSILSEARRQALADYVGALARRQGRHIPLVFDTAYEFLLHDTATTPPKSALHFDTEGVVYEVGSLSKILAPALRMGYCVGPPGPLVDAMAQRTSDAGFSAPLFVQEAASWLLEHHIEVQIARVNAEYARKGAAMRQGIQEVLGPHLEQMTGGRAGFYYYLTLRGVETHTQSRFFRYLARTTGDETVDGPPDARHPRVVYLPGEYFVHPEGELVEVGKRQLRLSYGYEDSAAFGKAMELMGGAVGYAMQ